MAKKKTKSAKKSAPKKAVEEVNIVTDVVPEELPDTTDPIPADHITRTEEGPKGPLLPSELPPRDYFGPYVEVTGTLTPYIWSQLTSQPRVRFYIPKQETEGAGAYETVTIQFIRFKIMKGFRIEIPEAIAEQLETYMRVESGDTPLVRAWLSNREATKEGTSVRNALV